MKEKSTLTGKIKNCAIPGLITLGVVIFTLIFKGIWPFGSNRIDYFDNMQQVAPLYAHLWDWMHGNASIWFDWYTGLGTNVSMSISAFTMLSPFNLLLYLIPRNLILESISILTALKMVCMSVTMYIYLDSKFARLQDCLKTIFAVMFSLSGYVILYGSCFTPWMDVVAVFPLLMLAFENMMKQGKKLFYIIMLALMFIMNYYLGAMSLIYIFMLSGIYILTSEQKKKWKHQIWDLGIGTVAGMGLSCFVLIPVMMQLSSSQRGSSGTNLLDQYKGWITSAIISDGTMAAFQRWMMFFGLSFVIAIIVAGVRKYWGIERRKTITMLLTTALVVIPVIVQGTNLMWHFGSYNGYSLRNGYLIAFTLISVASYYAEKMYRDRETDKSLIKKQLIFAAVVCIAYAIGYNLIPDNNEIIAIIFFGIIFIVLTVMYIIRLGKEGDDLNCRHVVVLVFVELFIGAYALIGPPKFYTYEDYQVGDYVQDANEVYDTLGLAESATDRIINPDISLNANYPLILRRGALSSFTAALQSDTQSYAKRWGYSKYFLWLLDSGGTVFTNALIHVTEAVNQLPLDSTMYTYKNTSGDYSVYTANYQLPFAMAVDNSIATENMNGNWVTMHNAMYKAITGDKEELVTGVPYSISRTSTTAEYELTVDGNEALYMSIVDINNRNSDANCSWLISSMHIYVNGEEVNIPTLGDVNNTAYFTDYNNNLVYLGCFNNETVNVKVVYDDPWYMKVSETTIAKLNMDKMKAMCETKQKDECNVSYTNNSLTVTLKGSASKNYAIIPVIYSDNWKVTVNGKTAKIREIAGLFTGVNIYAGDNTIQMTFDPKGRKEGLIISLAVLIITILCVVINHFKKINVPNIFKYCGEFVYFQLLNAVVVAMFLIPVIAAVPALIYQIIIRIIQLF